MTEIVHPTTDLRQLGQKVRAHLDDPERSAEVLREARSRFRLEAMERAAGARRLPGWLTPGNGRTVGGTLTVAALAAAVVLVATFGRGVFWSDSAPLTVAVESTEAELVGSWVSSEEETKQLGFSDGTALSLHPHTKLRIRKTTASGATVELGRGRTLARVKHDEDATWRFLAGPFVVRVTGTEFDLAWDPDERVLELALHQGAVMLSGPTVSGERAVRKGQFVRVAVPRDDKHIQADEESHDDLSQVQNDQDAAEQESHSKSADPVDKAQNKSASKPSWKESLHSGTPAEAVQAVQKAGKSVVLASASPGELWSLASKARLGGQPALARDALLALRSKHGTRGQTSYLLGKVHADQLGATSQAITWFETYLKEAPGGSLAEQAMGRLAELQAGTRAGKRAAKRYLANYPSGSYADFCRSQLR